MVRYLGELKMCAQWAKPLVEAYLSASLLLFSQLDGTGLHVC